MFYNYKLCQNFTSDVFCDNKQEWEDMFEYTQILGVIYEAL